MRPPPMSRLTTHAGRALIEEIGAHRAEHRLAQLRVAVQEQHQHVEIEEAAMVRDQQNAVVVAQPLQPLEADRMHHVARAERHPAGADGAQPPLGQRQRAPVQEVHRAKRRALERLQQLERRRRVGFVRRRRSVRFGMAEAITGVPSRRVTVS